MTVSRMWLRRALEIVLIVVLFAGVRAWQQRDVMSGPAPMLVGRLLDGSSYALPARPERPVLVYFWATWCPVCRMEQDNINALAKNFDVITIAMQSGGIIEVTKYMSEQSLKFPVLVDSDGAVSRGWGLHGVPASFVVDREGKLRFVEIGYTTEVGLRVRLWLASW